MSKNLDHKIEFIRLTEIPKDEIKNHMSNPRLAEHMPLLTFEWTDEAVEKFVTAKEECWHRDGLGHWAITDNGEYIGWGGFQKEGDEWDFGLVLKPEIFGLGLQITKKALAIARQDARIPYVTFLLPPSRKNLGALKRFGAEYVGDIEYDGALFRKYRLDT